MKGVLAFVVGAILFLSAGGRVADSQTEVSARIQNYEFAGSSPHLEKVNQQQQILSATIMMTITTPNWQEKAVAAGEALPIPNDEYRPIARADGHVAADGLGTLVAGENKLLLVTHDHWSHFDDALGTVTFRSADGSWLADMDLSEFKEHVLSRNGGVMEVTAPDTLKKIIPIEAAALPANTLQTGDSGFMARQAGNRVIVSEVSVIAQAEQQGRPVVRLQSVDGQIVTGGDSGGGVWVDDRFAAAMWTTVMMENRATGVRRTTDVSIAAIYQGS